MATIFNQETVSPEREGQAARRQRLLTTERTPGTAILLDRLALEPGGAVGLSVPQTSVAWLQVLDGEAVLARGSTCEALTGAHVAFLPPGFSGTLSAGKDRDLGATLLFGEIPDAARLDPGFASNPPAFRLSDWTREPVLDSEHDARQRIYLVTPKLSGSGARRGTGVRRIFRPGRVQDGVGERSGSLHLAADRARYPRPQAGA